MSSEIIFIQILQKIFDINAFFFCSVDIEKKKFGIQTSKLSKVKLISFFHSTSSLSSIHLLLSNAIHRFKPKKGRRGWKNLPNLFADFVKFFSSMFLTLFQRLLACLPSLTLREGRSIEFQIVKTSKNLQHKNSSTQHQNWCFQRSYLPLPNLT